jgi:hypothetical protein
VFVFYIDCAIPCMVFNMLFPELVIPWPCPIHMPVNRKIQAHKNLVSSHGRNIDTCDRTQHAGLYYPITRETLKIIASDTADMAVMVTLAP